MVIQYPSRWRWGMENSECPAVHWKVKQEQMIWKVVASPLSVGESRDDMVPSIATLPQYISSQIQVKNGLWGLQVRIMRLFQV